MLIRTVLIAVLVVLSQPLNACENGLFADVQIGYNFDSPGNGQDFQGGRDLAIFQLGYEEDGHQIGIGHISHWFRGWPFHQDKDEEEIDLYLYYGKRWRIRW